MHNKARNPFKRGFSLQQHGMIGHGGGLSPSEYGGALGSLAHRFDRLPLIK
jgi:hypothetical protein